MTILARRNFFLLVELSAGRHWTKIRNQERETLGNCLIRILSGQTFFSLLTIWRNNEEFGLESQRLLNKTQLQFIIQESITNSVIHLYLIINLIFKIQNLCVIFENDFEGSKKWFSLFRNNPSPKNFLKTIEKDCLKDMNILSR